MLSTQHYNETAFSPFMLNFVPLEIDGFFLGNVSQTLKTGYHDAIEAYNAYPQDSETDALLAPQEYALLASRTYQGPNFTEYARGFVAGWIACVFGLVQ
jgi:hypothetical protein